MNTASAALTEQKSPLHHHGLLRLCLGAMDGQIAMTMAAFAASVLAASPSLALPSANAAQVIMSPDAASVAEEGRMAAREIGSFIWAAKTTEELDDILDAALDDERLWGLSHVASRSMRYIRETQDRSWFKSILAKASNRSRVSTAMINAAHVATALGKAIAIAESMLGSTISSVDMDPPNLYKNAIEVLKSAMESRKFIFAFIALFDYATSSQVYPDEILNGVIDWWVRGSLSNLRMLAMITDRNEELLKGIEHPSKWLNKEETIRHFNERSEPLVHEAILQLTSEVPRHRAITIAAHSVVVEIADAVKRYAPGRDLPPIEVTQEDGSVLVEWVLKGRRIGVTFATRRVEGGWYYASSEDLGKEFIVGKLKDLDVAFLVRKALMIG